MQNKITVPIGVLFVISFLIGCASTPVKPQMQAIVFQQPVEKTQKAAIDALVVLGFNVKKSEPLYVEGSRPHRLGSLFDSGGETVGVWLEALEMNRTRVRVNTAKSLYGQMGQKNWDDKILVVMKKFLGEKEE